ncbi:MAG: hypothetical protein ABII12_09970, partial [Planctomycetota bacterium]
MRSIYRESPSTFLAVFRPPMVVLLSIASLLGTTAVAHGQWPQWGGPNRDFAADAPTLATTWPEGGPKPLWKRTLGDGYSSVIVADNRLHTMYRAGEEEVVVALSPESGRT